MAGVEEIENVLQTPTVGPETLAGGILLIAAALILVFLLKRFIVNLLLGIIGLIVVYMLGIPLPLLPTLVVTILFGLGGLGTMLVLYFLGVV